MKNLTLTISNISYLQTIQSRLAKNKPISTVDKAFLAEFLAQLPTADTLMIDKIPLDKTFNVTFWDHSKENLRCWVELFAQTPGWDYTAFCYMTAETDRDMLSKNVIAIAQFAPSMSHNLDNKKRAYEVWLKDNGSAVFYLPTLEDAEKFPDMYNFKGTWKEAYLLLIETLKKGWPMEEFPEELQQFLKK